MSILIPAYNAEAWLPDTIQSALDQTWSRKEIIILDDGSRDQTLAVARRFASNTVSVITQANQGAASARNKALSLAQGDYIQWLDADDLLSPDKMERQLRLVEAKNSPFILLSSGWAPFIYRTSRAGFDPTLLWQDLDPLEWLLRKWENNLHMQTATWLVSRELTSAAGPWDTRLLSDDDGEYFCRVIKNCQGIKFAPGAKVYYRITGGSRLSYIGKSDAKKESMCLGMEKQISYLRSMGDSPRIRAACVNYLQTWFLSFYPERPDLYDRMQRLARELGGELNIPRLGWKYDWIQKTMGWTAAKSAQANYNYWKGLLLHVWDQWSYRRERRDGVLNESTAGSPPALPRQS